MTREEHLAAIKQADHEYYDLDNPTLSDAEYDELRRSYIDQYGAKDLNYVPGNVADGFEKFEHPVAVTSLGKWTKDVDTEKELIKKINELWPVEIQPKYDGLTVVAYPDVRDGSCTFVTRGLGGEVGEILPNFIPEYEGASVNNLKAQVRGEVFITPANFARLNEALKAAGEEPMKNMRNAAAGLLRRKERSPYLNLLSYVVYDIPGQDSTPQEIKDALMKYTKFDVTNSQSFDTIEETITGIEQMYADIIADNNCPIDGIVIKSCQKGSLKKFGSTGHHNKNALAWKPGRTIFTTYVRDVIWQMGRSKATPVAIVDPVEIDGATVTKASLHNAEQIKKLGLKIGAKVTIYKANEIIPQIGEVLEPGDKDIVLDVCPACGGPLETVNGQQFCTNPDCVERIAQNIAFLGQKDVLDIPGLSIQTARKIVDMYDTSDDKQNIIFNMSVEDIAELPGFAEKSAQKLYDAIQNASQNVELPRFIKALCIEGIGNDIGKKMADHFGSLFAMGQERKLQGSTDAFVKNVLLKINGIGPVAAETLASQEFWDAVDDLSELVTIAPYEKKEVVVGEFVGKVFVLTGKMEHPRSYYVEKIEAAGGKEGSAVNSKTDYLVIQDVNSQSTKAKKARELGTKLISPEELEDMLNA